MLEEILAEDYMHLFSMSRHEKSSGAYIILEIFDFFG